jgi:heme/copper-type cytochrome/quinol oxidase subunit 4
MRTLLTNIFIGIIAISIISYYSLNSDGGDIIYVFLTTIYFLVHFLLLAFFKSEKDKKWSFIAVLICVIISFIVFYCINEKKKLREPNVTLAL